MSGTGNTAHHPEDKRETRYYKGGACAFESGWQFPQIANTGRMEQTRGLGGHSQGGFGVAHTEARPGSHIVCEGSGDGQGPDHQVVACDLHGPRRDVEARAEDTGAGNHEACGNDCADDGRQEYSIDNTPPHDFGISLRVACYHTARQRGSETERGEIQSERQVSRSSGILRQ